MAEVTITLIHGIKVGDDVLREVVLREPTAGDIIEAQEESERLVYATRGDRVEPTLVASPTMVGIHVLRRQIKRIGDISGPVDLHLLKKLHPADMDTLQAEADKLDAATAAEVASREVARRGRNDGDGGES